MCVFAHGTQEHRTGTCCSVPGRRHWHALHAVLARAAGALALGPGARHREVVGLRIGNFVLVTFPGALSVEIGLGIKQRSPHPYTFVAGVTNGYIYYTPTEAQLENRGSAQEDSDCMLAPEWQEIFETRAIAMLKQL